MKGTWLRICGFMGGLLFLLAGCGERKADAAMDAYEQLLSGDLSLLNEGDLSAWALDSWMDILLASGELEYACLDLDGDGVDELLLQWIGDPGSYNGVFHYDGGQIRCWQSDGMEASCRDYPLRDGTMVRQYDFNGTRSYTLFRYRPDGSQETAASLFAREERIPEDSPEPCPYYRVNGEEVGAADFQTQFDSLITQQLLEPSAWTCAQH